MQPLTMKSLIINCLAAYGAYRLVTDYVEANYGIEIVVHDKKKELAASESAKVEKKKGWSVTVSR